MIDKFEEQLHQDLHQFLQSMKEIDARLPECPDVEEKWEQIVKAYIPDGIREFNDLNGKFTQRLKISTPT